MFGNLRIGTPIYVLNKTDLLVEEGEVQFISAPQPQYTTIVAGAMQPPKLLVDIKVKVGDRVLDLQKIPTDQMVADFGDNGMVVSESREAILNEVLTIRKQSKAILDSRVHHEERVKKCDDLVKSLNPAARHEEEQRQEIDALKERMSTMSDDMTDIKGMLTKLLNKSKKED